MLKSSSEMDPVVVTGEEEEDVKQPKKKCSCKGCCTSCLSGIKNFDYKSFVKNHWPRLLIVLFLILVIIYVIVDYAVLGYIQKGLDAYAAWVRNNIALGLVTYSLIYFVAVILFIPGSILTLGAGLAFVAAFGVGLGLLAAVGVVFVGAWSGSMVAFVLGRFVFKKVVDEHLVKKYKIMAAIDRAFLDHGLKLNCLLRLSPLIPFSAFNYFMGATSCKFWHFAVGTICIIPGTVMYCYIGAIPSLVMGMNANTEQAKTQRIVTIVTFSVGGLVTLIVVIWITCYAKKILKKIVEEEEAKKKEEEELEALENGEEETPLKDDGGDRKFSDGEKTAVYETDSKPIVADEPLKNTGS